ncbi:MAG: hypothetical protein Q4A17_06500 [Thermoguttaceae bacterium]|nr:hypothetical protein [Thermoguttaceae bacterium]
MKETKYPLTAPEEQVKACVAKDWFSAYDTTQYIGNIDFAVAVSEAGQGTLLTNWLFWAEAKKGTAHDIDESFVQLILTIGRARTFDRQLPPRYLGAFDAGRIAFLPYHAIQDVFTINDFNWNVAPNNHKTKEFVFLKKRVSGILANEKLMFDYLADGAELRKFILQNFAQHAKAGVTKIQITKNNFTHIYNKWRMAVKPTIGVPDWEAAKKEGIIDADFFLADILSRENSTLTANLNILLQNDRYRQVVGKSQIGLPAFSDIPFKDGQKAHAEFWRLYERPPKEEYWDYIVNRRDLLVPQDIRETKGAFFTPRPWVELSQEYLARALGENWQDEYYIWDCCAGTGNLLAGLVNRKNIWASTLEQQDVDVMLQRIANMNEGLAGDEEGANLFPSHVFQFDFLNDPFTKLPQDLQDIINDPEKRKKLVIYINPPYKEATNVKQKSGTGDNVARLTKGTPRYELYIPEIGLAARELFAQFFYRIYKEIPGCVLGEFSKLKVLQAQNFEKFRQQFKARLANGFVVPANTFDNVKGHFPIGFMVWRLDCETVFADVSLDVYDKDGNALGQKFFHAPDQDRLVIDWLRQFYDKRDEKIGYLRMVGTDVQNSVGVFIVSKLSPNDERKHLYTTVTRGNVIPCAIYVAIRHCIPCTWLNDRDQFLFPDDSWNEDWDFQSDCLIWVIFDNVIRSADGVNHWVPFSEDEMGAKDEIKSHFMIDILSGKTPLSAPEQEQTILDFMDPAFTGTTLPVSSNKKVTGTTLPASSETSPERGGGPKGRRGSETGENPSFGRNPPASLCSAAPLSGEPLNDAGSVVPAGVCYTSDDAGSVVPVFSPEARAVLDAALPIYRYYQTRPNANPNASFYDIRQYFQGVDDKGRMNNVSADEKYNQMLAELRQAQKRLAAKIADGVYRHGFLK